MSFNDEVFAMVQDPLPRGPSAGLTRSPCDQYASVALPAGVGEPAQRLLLTIYTAHDDAVRLNVRDRARGTEAGATADDGLLIPHAPDRVASRGSAHPATRRSRRSHGKPPPRPMPVYLLGSAAGWFQRGEAGAPDRPDPTPPKWVADAGASHLARAPRRLPPTPSAGSPERERLLRTLNKATTLHAPSPKVDRPSASMFCPRLKPRPADWHTLHANGPGAAPAWPHIGGIKERAARFAAIGPRRAALGGPRREWLPRRLARVTSAQETRAVTILAGRQRSVRGIEAQRAAGERR
jgi:hypothetical protein